MNNDKVYFKNLDSIRFIAALIVFLGHAIYPSYKFLPIENTYIEKFLLTISDGGTGVSIFFVLSGFLITYLLISEHEIKSTISLKKFYIRRFLRTWPLYFAVVAFSFAIYPMFKTLLGINNPLASNFLYYLVFLSNFDVINVEKFHVGGDAMIQNVMWSVSIEEQFYLFWPLIFTFLPKRFWIYPILLVIAGSLFFRIMNNDDQIVLNFHTFSVLVDLGIGALMALLIKENVKVKRFFEQSSTKTHLILMIIAFCLILWKEEIFFFPLWKCSQQVVQFYFFCTCNNSSGDNQNRIKTKSEKFNFC